MLERVLDPYERKARLTPALLALAPVLAILVGLYGINLELTPATLGMLTAIGVFYVMASIARELGKRLEVGLFASWGGKPTTQLLRHANHFLDPVTKARYHAFLAQRIGVPFPTVAQEQRDPTSADHCYAAGTKWLLDQTRDTKRFALLFKENIAYGFRRNCLGLRPYALFLGGASLIWGLLSVGAIARDGIHVDVGAHITPGAWLAISVSIIALAVWLLFFNPRTVRTSAFAYADALLRTCDILSHHEGSGSDHRRSAPTSPRGGRNATVAE